MNEAMRDKLPRLVLASASKVRAEMLVRAGLNFHCDAADIDEAGLKEACVAQGMDATATAIALARAKAETVAVRHPRALVLGADQLLECDGAWFAKARNRVGARAALQALRGRPHRLISGAAVVGDGETLWQAAETATLSMWAFSDAFLDRYLDDVGDDALTSVGAYKIEGPGVRLFERIAGDHFTILGLPLLPFLAFLRRRQWLEGLSSG